MGDPDNKAEQIDELSYEESYRQLQDVLERLEAADLPLADSLELYEFGMKLAARWQPDGTLVEFGADQDQ